MKYWVYMNGQVPGSYTPQELAGLPGFTMTTLVCPAEGEILEKNWRRSAEHPEINEILLERDSKRPASPQAPSPEAALFGDVNSLIDATSARLFSHVTVLMKELESRREERAMTLSVQKQFADLKEELRHAREKAALLDPRLVELEESHKKDASRIQGLETSLKAKEDSMADLRVELEKTRTAFETTKRRLAESANDLAIRNRLVDRLSRDLTEKEMSLAKSLGVIRRLEEDLNRLDPAVTAVAEPEVPEADAAVPSAVTLPDAPEAAATAEEAARVQEPAAEPPPARAHEALVDLFKRFVSKYDH